MPGVARSLHHTRTAAALREADTIFLSSLNQLWTPRINLVVSSEKRRGAIAVAPIPTVVPPHSVAVFKECRGPPASRFLGIRPSRVMLWASPSCTSGLNSVGISLCRSWDRLACVDLVVSPHSSVNHIVTSCDTPSPTPRLLAVAPLPITVAPLFGTATKIVLSCRSSARSCHPFS